jgi:hypothetical protein
MQFSLPDKKLIEKIWGAKKNFLILILILILILLKKKKKKKNIWGTIFNIDENLY